MGYWILGGIVLVVVIALGGKNVFKNGGGGSGNSGSSGGNQGNPGGE